MDHAGEDPQTTINIIAGWQGATFDRDHLNLPAGALTIWVNQTETTQVILPDNAATRRVMTLAPRGQDGAVWVMQLCSSRQHPAVGGTFQWRLQSNDAAAITVLTTIEPALKPD